MSQQIKNLKEQIQKAFSDVESADFLKRQIERSKLTFSESFVEYMKRYPQSNFREWSERFIDKMNINSTVPSEIQVIGISLLALDELEHDITNAYVDSLKCLIKCESCEIETDVETMSQDDDSNWFCPDCWKALSPGMKSDFDDLKQKGEIE